jgi:capsular exopolysaccharide synthesis family protein
MVPAPGADAPRLPDRLPHHPAPNGNGKGAALAFPPAPAGPPAPPAALSAPPNALGLLQALHRRWILATCLGLLCATAAAAVTWASLPPGKYTARTLLRVPPGSPFIFKTNEPVPALGDHQRTQVALVKSRLVLNQALKEPGVSDLETIQNIIGAGGHPVEWLEKEVQADFAVAPEVLKIAFSGYKPDELTKIVRAIHKAYASEVLGREKVERDLRLRKLHQMRVKYEMELKEKKKDQRELMKDTGAADASAAGQIQAYIQLQLSMNERELLQTQSELRRAKADLKAYEAGDKAAANFQVTDAMIDELFAKDMTALKYQLENRQLQETIDATIKRSAWGEKDPYVAQYKAQMQRNTESLAAHRKRVAPQLAEEVRTYYRSEAAKNLKAAQARIPFLEEEVNVLQKEVDDLRGKLQKQISNIVKMDVAKEDMTQLEETTKRIAAEEEALRIELEAPERTSVLEEDVVVKANDALRLFGAVGGAAAVALAAVLLGVGWWEFRARRISSPDEVSAGLGVQVVGVIPDSVRRSASQSPYNDPDDKYSVLTDAVDATRTMVIQAARAEGLRVIMVTSAQSGEGKTTLSTHLAASLAQVGYRTLLIDGDLRNPVAHQVFDLPVEPGFCDLLRGDAEPAVVTLPTPVEGLSAIPAGKWDSLALRALAQDGAGRVLAALRENYDFVIIDTSPVLPVIDALLIGQHTDGTLLAVLRDVSRMAGVYAAHQRLTAGRVRILGAVVNGVRGGVYGAAYPYRARHQPSAAAEAAPS